MRFVWNEDKRGVNLSKHKLDFRDAGTVFSGPTFTFEDKRSHYREQRWVSIGLLRGVVVVIVHTETEDTIRIISMRRATKHEQGLFFTNL